MMTGNVTCENTINEFLPFSTLIGVIVALVLKWQFFYINTLIFAVLLSLFFRVFYDDVGADIIQ